MWSEFAVAVVIIILLIVYMTKSERMSGLGVGDARNINAVRRITLHYTTWCPACRNMAPIWDGVKANLSQSGIEFIEINEETAKTPYIKAYPTIIMLTETGKRVHYRGAPDFNQLRNWCLSPIPFTGPP